MVFSSYTFLFLFLPMAWLGHRLLAGRPNAALGWLVACSIFFYGFWKLVYVPLIVGSATFNYLFGYS
jgi:alginate O-acetyltransferase complex protein AlgI